MTETGDEGRLNGQLGSHADVNYVAEYKVASPISLAIFFSGCLLVLSELM